MIYGGFPRASDCLSDRCDTDSVNSPTEQTTETLADRLGVLKPRIVGLFGVLLRLRWLPVSDLAGCHRPDFDCPDIVGVPCKINNTLLNATHCARNSGHL